MRVPSGEKFASRKLYPPSSVNSGEEEVGDVKGKEVEMRGGDGWNVYALYVIYIYGCVRGGGEREREIEIE